MFKLSQRGLLVSCLVLCFLLSSSLAFAEPQAKLLFTIGKKEPVNPPNIFQNLGGALFGIESNEDYFTNITGVGVDGEDNIYLADPGKRRIVVLDKNGKMTERGDIGKSILKNPVGVAIDSRGRIYVSDAILNQLIVFRKDGILEFSVNGDGTPKGALIRPSGVLVDEKNNRIIVSDTGNHRLQLFNLNGEFVSFVGSEGNGDKEFKFPTFLAKDSKGNTYVVDTINSRVQVFDGKFKFLDKFGDYGDALGYFGRPKGIAIDSRDNIYVSDAIFNVISMFDKDKKPVMAFGWTEKTKNGLGLPMGVAVNSKDEIIVANSQNSQLNIYKIVW